MRAGPCVTKYYELATYVKIGQFPCLTATAIGRFIKFWVELEQWLSTFFIQRPILQPNLT